MTFPNEDDVYDGRVVFYTGELSNDEFTRFNKLLIRLYGFGVHDGVQHWIDRKYPTECPYLRATSSGEFAGNYAPDYSEGTPINAKTLLNPIWLKG